MDDGDSHPASDNFNQIQCVEKHNLLLRPWRGAAAGYAFLCFFLLATAERRSEIYYFFRERSG